MISYLQINRLIGRTSTRLHRVSNPRVVGCRVDGQVRPICEIKKKKNRIYAKKIKIRHTRPRRPRHTQTLPSPQRVVHTTRGRYSGGGRGREKEREGERRRDERGPYIGIFLAQLSSPLCDFLLLLRFFARQWQRQQQPIAPAAAAAAAGCLMGGVRCFFKAPVEEYPSCFWDLSFSAAAAAAGR